jgi:hypothetical protein
VLFEAGLTSEKLSFHSALAMTSNKISLLGLQAASSCGSDRRIREHSSILYETFKYQSANSSHLI